MNGKGDRNRTTDFNKFRNGYDYWKENERKELKDVLFELGASHARLSNAEYKRNPSYNNEHYSYKAEKKLLEFLTKNNCLDEFMELITQVGIHG